MSVVVIGRNGMIARALARRPETANWLFLTHQQARQQQDWLDGCQTLVNLAYDPLQRQYEYNESDDFDLFLARRLVARSDGRFLMASSRMVYGPAAADGRLAEDMALRPVTPYGRARARTELELDDLLGERLTVLRLSNIFGDELIAGRTNFFALALHSLVQRGRISLDMAPFVERDFLPVELLVGWLPRIVRCAAPGVFNLGAGRGTATGRIVQWLIEGYGKGEMLVTSMREHDPFWLDMHRADAAFGIAGADTEQLRECCLALGRRAAEHCERQEHAL